MHHAAIGYLAAHGWLRRGGAWYTQLAKKWWVVGRARRPARVDGSARPTASGGPTPEIVRVDRVLGPSSTTPVAAPDGAAPDGAALAVVRFHNAVPFTAHYDGNTLALAPDARAHWPRAREPSKTSGRARSARTSAPPTRGACYLMPHPHGEPHFFVKPWAFTETFAGWSSIIEGVRGPSWDVMRGVVWCGPIASTPRRLCSRSR